MEKVFHVVPHSHWDREWYFNTSRSKVYLMKDLKDVLDVLETNAKFSHFVMDAQASLIEDYLKWRPQDKKRLTKLVSAGKLLIGPWYTQTDQLVISGESIVRNLAYGMAICEQFGRYMNIGYVPDCFGQGGNMPQIYREFGIEDMLFWRGVSDDDLKETEFKWIGEDGTEIYAYQIPSGYYIGGNLPENEADLAQLLKNEPFKTVIDRVSTNQVYFPNGFDQAPIRKNLPELIDKMNKLYPESTFKLSSPEEYIASVKSEKKAWNQLAGELVNGKLMRIHKSIFSSRSDLKQMNTKIQHYLVNVLEPVLTMGAVLGFDYPHEPVAEIWKLMFENAAHDSIGSCVSDNTNEDVYMRYKQARDISINLVELTLREIATRIHNPKAQAVTYTIFNTLDTVRSGTVEAMVYVPQKQFGLLNPKGELVPYTLLSLEDQTDYVNTQTIRLNPSKEIYLPDTVYLAKIAFAAEEIPSLGYCQFTLDLKQNSLSKTVAVETDFLENDFYKITINEQGTLDILDKQNGHFYPDQAVLEENGDDGDSFNYSPPRQDLITTSHDATFEYTIEKSAVLEKAVITYQLIIPANLEERAAGKTSIVLPVTLTVQLNKNSAVIDYSVEVENKGLSHRLCLLFDTQIAAKHSIADHLFGTLERPVRCEKDLALWQADQAHWNEKPISIETCQSFVSLADKNHGVAILPKGVREYEIVGKQFSIIRITIFRSYGYMGRENLLYRPGRASGEKIIATPDAQLLKNMRFDLSAYYYQTDFNKSNTAAVAKAANTPLEMYQYAEFLNGRLIFSLEEVAKTLPAEYSLLHTTGELILSAVKKAETRNGVVLRYYNGRYHAANSMTITFKKKLKMAQLTDLKENAKESLKISDNQLKLKDVGHNKFVTVYVEFED